MLAQTRRGSRTAAGPRSGELENRRRRRPRTGREFAPNSAEGHRLPCRQTTVLPAGPDCVSLSSGTSRGSRARAATASTCSAGRVGGSDSSPASHTSAMHSTRACGLWELVWASRSCGAWSSTTLPRTWSYTTSEPIPRPGSSSLRPSATVSPLPGDPRDPHGDGNQLYRPYGPGLRRLSAAACSVPESGTRRWRRARTGVTLRRVG
jgi:hypothetical protein